MLVSISDDFSPEKIIRSGQSFRAFPAEEGSFLFLHKESVLHLRQAASRMFEVSADSETWETLWRPYFDLDRNYSVIRSSIPA